MKKQDNEKLFQNLPLVAADYIRLVIKKMGYRRKVRQEVQAELIAHFEDALAECKDDKAKEEKTKKLIEEFGDAKLLGILARRAKKRCRSMPKKAILALGHFIFILIICYVLYFVWFWFGVPSITTDYVAKLNEFAHPTADESLNAEPYYQKAIKFYVPPPEKPKQFFWPDDASIEKLDPNTRAIVETLVAQNAAALEQIELGNQKPYYWKECVSPNGRVMGVKIEGLQEQVNLARLLIWRARFKAYHKDYAGAFDDIMICYRFGTHLKPPTSLAEQLTGMRVERFAIKTAFDLLQEKDINKQTLTDFQKQLQDATNKNNFIINLGGEKFFVDDEIQRTFTGDMWGSHIMPRAVAFLIQQTTMITSLGSGQYEQQVTSPPSKKSRWRWFAECAEDIGFYFRGMFSFIMEYNYLLFKHPDKEKTMEQAKVIYDFENVVATKTPYEVKQQGIDENCAMRLIKKNRFLEILRPAFHGVYALSFRHRCYNEALLTTLAIFCYKQDAGDYPEALNQLMEAGYLKQVPMDPYSDKPLVYRTTESNFTLYSVGKNFIDDGGAAAYDSKGKLQMWGFAPHGGDAVYWPVPEEKVKSQK